MGLHKGQELVTVGNLLLYDSYRTMALPKALISRPGYCDPDPVNIIIDFLSRSHIARDRSNKLDILPCCEFALSQ